MTYSVDLRKRVVSFILSGGKKSEAMRRFSVSRKTIYNWLNSKDIMPKKHGERRRKIDKKALLLDVQNYPDKTLQERANQFSVVDSSICKALKKMKISHKKRTFVTQKDVTKNA